MALKRSGEQVQSVSTIGATTPQQVIYLNGRDVRVRSKQGYIKSSHNAWIHFSFHSMVLLQMINDPPVRYWLCVIWLWYTVLSALITRLLTYDDSEYSNHVKTLHEVWLVRQPPHCCWPLPSLYHNYYNAAEGITSAGNGFSRRIRK